MWTLQIKPAAKKIFDKFDQHTQKKISKYLYEKVIKDPYSFGKPLSANLVGYWRYRVGDYRIICEIKNKELIIFVVEVDHRSKIYDR